MNHYTTTFFIVLTLFLVTPFKVFSQEYGFKIGTNWTSFKGEKEMDINRKPLEFYVPKLGFHLGFTSDYAFTDNIGMRVEMLYAQKSVLMRYAGEATKFFYTQNTKRRIIAKGQLTSKLNVTNTYFELPLSIYFKTDGRIDFSLGASFAFLATSKGVGEMTFEGNTEGGYPIPQFASQLNYKFTTDTDSTVVLSDRAINVEENGIIQLPESMGAYYENRSSEQSFFKTIDIGLIGELKYWLTDNLGLGGRVTYSLRDITNNQADFLRYNIDSEKNLIRTLNDDRFLSLQVSLLFRL
jgi:hypothetical protein